jgi:hypothetical protein
MGPPQQPRGGGAKATALRFSLPLLGSALIVLAHPPPCQIKKMRAASDWRQRTWTKDGPSFRLMPSQVRAFVQTRLASTPRQCVGPSSETPSLCLYGFVVAKIQKLKAGGGGGGGGGGATFLHGNGANFGYKSTAG